MLECGFEENGFCENRRSDCDVFGRRCLDPRPIRRRLCVTVLGAAMSICDRRKVAIMEVIGLLEAEQGVETGIGMQYRRGRG